jgi:hypothetical protein
MLNFIFCVVYVKNSCIFVPAIKLITNKTIEIMKTINYNGMMITFNENQTVGNCIDLGFSTEKTKEIIEDLREKGIDYLNKRKLESYR